MLISEDEDGSRYMSHLTIEERIVLIPKHFAASLNNVVGFIQSVTLLFKKIFIDNDVTSVYNLKILSDIYAHGILSEEHFYEMIYCIIGNPIQEDDEETY